MKPHQVDDILFITLILLPSVAAFFQPLAAIPVILLGSITAFKYYSNQPHKPTRKLQSIYRPTAIFTLLMSIPAILVVIFH